MPYNNYIASKSMSLQEGINLSLCGQQNSMCSYNMHKIIVNIDVLRAKLRERGKKGSRGFCWRRQAALQVCRVFGCVRVLSEQSKRAGSSRVCVGIIGYITSYSCCNWGVMVVEFGASDCYE